MERLDDAVSFEDVRYLLQNEQACLRVLFEARWPDGFRCPRCDRSDYYLISTRTLPLYECPHCRKQTSLIAGTVFQGTRTPLHLWFQAIWLHCRPGGVNAKQLAESIGVTYKTAWTMCHKLRHAMSEAEASWLLNGVVRINDAWIVHRPRATMDWLPQEQPVLVGGTEGENGKPERVKIKHQDKSIIPNRFASPDPTLFIMTHVAPEARRSAVYTRRIKERNRELFQIVWGAENWLADVFRGIGPKHLQAYLDQYCYVWNRKGRPLFGELVRWCASVPTVTYPMLTRKKPVRPKRPDRCSAEALVCAAS